MTRQQNHCLCAATYLLCLADYTEKAPNPATLLQWLYSCKSEVDSKTFCYLFFLGKSLKIEMGGWSILIAFLSVISLGSSHAEPGAFSLFLWVLQDLNGSLAAPGLALWADLDWHIGFFSSSLPWGHWFWSISSQCLLTVTWIKTRQGEVII